MNVITSRANALVVQTAKLRDKKRRDESKTFLFEGIKLTREAISSGIELESIFLTEKFAKKHPDLAFGNNVYLVSESVFSKISENSAPEGIACVAKQPEALHRKYTSISELDLNSVCLLLSDLQDPGNLGTVARTSAAFGKKTLILSNDCADIYNQKTLRASMGALFRTSTFRTADLNKVIRDIRDAGVKVYAAALDRNAAVLQNVQAKTSCFVIGNEGAGLDRDVIDACSGTIVIPMEKDSESLNAAAAATVILWETYR